MRLTIHINPKDILAVTHADDGRAVISFAISADSGCSLEVALTVEEQADDVIEMLMNED